MVGELGRGLGDALRQRGVVRERRRVRRVQAYALAGQQLLVDRLAQQRVAERVRAALGLEHDQLRRDRLAQRVGAHRLVQLEDRGQQAVADAPPARGQRAQHAPRRLGELLDPDAEDVAQGRREAGSRPGGHELLGVERVALRAREHRLEQAGIHRVPDDAGELLGQLPLRERPQVDPLDTAGAHELGQQRAQRVRAADVVDSIGADDQDALALQVAHEEADQVARRGIGPVEVLQDQQDRTVRPRTRQPVEHQRLQPCGWLSGQLLGDRSGQRRRVIRGVGLVVEVAHRARHRQQGDRGVLETGTLTPRDAHAVGRRQRDQLREQPALADARLAADQDNARRAVPGARHRRRELADLARASGEDLAGEALRHAASISP